METLKMGRSWFGYGLAMIALVLTVAAKDLPQAPFEMSEKGYTMLQQQQDVPPGTALAFDRRNRPYWYDPNTTWIWTLRDGKWVKLEFAAALAARGITFSPERQPEAYAALTLDAADHLYLLIPKPYQANGSFNQTVLLYSADGGTSFQAYPVPVAANQVAMEMRSGANPITEPPAIVTSQFLRQLPGEKEFRWARLNSMKLFLPRKTAQGLEWGEPIGISEEGFGLTPHSGGDSVAVSSGNKVFVAYVRKPADLRRGGNPTYVMTVNRDTRKVEAENLVLNAAPQWADNHSNPGLVMDDRKHLHLVTGAHYGGSFYYREAAVPESATKWLPQQTVGSDQTYVALVAGQGGELFLAPRIANRLEFQRKSAGGSWSEPGLFAARADYRGYSVYYHHLYRDRRGNLYLAFCYNDKNTRIRPKLLALSTDGGRRWCLASSAAMQALADR